MIKKLYKEKICKGSYNFYVEFNPLPNNPKTIKLCLVSVNRFFDGKNIPQQEWEDNDFNKYYHNLQEVMIEANKRCDDSIQRYLKEFFPANKNKCSDKQLEKASSIIREYRKIIFSVEENTKEYENIYKKIKILSQFISFNRWLRK